MWGRLNGYILPNFEFINTELVENTIHYLNNDEKEVLVKEGGNWGFNGKGFKSKTKLLEYIFDKGDFFIKKNL